MWGGRLDRELRKFMIAEKPDILCLQEAISFDASNDSGFFFTIENIQAELGLKYSVIAPVFSFRYMNGVAKFSNCILSRYPILKSETVFTHLEHKEDFIFGQDSSNVRNFIHAVIETDKKQCNILTHHGYHVPEHKHGNEETMRQMALLSNYIKELDGPVILTGDFNLAPTSESLKELNSQLTNLSMTHKLETTRNQLVYKTEVCDYVFVSDQVKVDSFKAREEIVSDHKALELKFSI